MSSEETAVGLGPSEAQLKKKRNAARWGSIAGVVFALVMIVRAVDIFIPKGMPHCDEVQPNVESLINEGMSRVGSTAKVKALTGVQEGQRSGTVAECKATVTMTDSEKGLASYKIERSKGQDMVFLTGLKQL